MPIRNEVLNTCRHWLDEGDEVDRCNSARALGSLARCGDDPAIAALVARLTDEDVDVCVDAATALGRIGDAGAIPTLIESLETEQSGEVCVAVVEALGRLGKGDETVIAALIKTASARPEHLTMEGKWDHWWDIQLKAVEALGQMRAESAVPTLKSILEDEEGQDIESEVLAALGRIGGKGTDLLAERLHSSFSRERRRTVRALGYDRDAKATTLLVTALNDADGEVRAAAVCALAARGAEQAGTILPLLADPEPEVRAAAVEAVDTMGAQGALLDSAVRNELIALLDDTSPAVREAALRLLRNLKGEPEDGLRERVARLLDDRHSSVALGACDFVVAAGMNECVPNLIAALQDTERLTEIRVRAALAIGALARAVDEGVITALTSATLDDQRPVRMASLEALVALDNATPADLTPRPLEPVLRIVSDEPVADEATAGHETPETAAIAEEKSAAEAAVEADLADYNPRPEVGGAGEQAMPLSTLDAITQDNVNLMLNPPTASSGPVMDAAAEDDEETAEFRAIISRVLADRDFISPDRNPDARLDRRRMAARALGKSTHPSCVPVLIQALQAEDPELVQAAAEALAMLALRLPETAELLNAVGPLMALLNLGVPAIRVRAARALGALRHRAALPLLVDALGAEEPSLRMRAIEAITAILQSPRKGRRDHHMVTQELSDREVIERLLEHLADSNSSVRISAAEKVAELAGIVVAHQLADASAELLLAAAFEGSGGQARTMGRTLGKVAPEIATERLVARMTLAHSSIERRFVFEMLEEVAASAPPERLQEALAA